jgi:hypothetical protein
MIHKAQKIEEYLKNYKVGQEIGGYNSYDVWRGEVEHIMENWEDLGFDEKPTEEEAENRASEDSEIYQWAYESEIDNLNSILKQKCPNGKWMMKGSRMGWQNITGYRDEIEIIDFQDLINKTFPRTSNFSFHVYEYGRDGLAIKISHHDSPMGEWRYMIPITTIDYILEDLKRVTKESKPELDEFVKYLMAEEEKKEGEKKKGQSMSNQINLKELSVEIKPTFDTGYIAKSKDGDVEVERIVGDSVYLRMAGKLVISNKYDVNSMGLNWERKAQYAIPGIQMTEEDVEVKQRLAEDLRKLIDEYEIIGLDKYDIVEAIEKMINSRLAIAKAKIQPVDLIDKNKLDAHVTEKVSEIIDKIRNTEVTEEDVAGMIFNLLNELGRWGTQEVKGEEEKKTAQFAGDEDINAGEQFEADVNKSEPSVNPELVESAKKLIKERVTPAMQKMKLKQLTEDNFTDLIFGLLKDLDELGLHFFTAADLVEDEIIKQKQSTAATRNIIAAAMQRLAPGHGIVNEDLWDKAKKAADKSYNKDSESDKYWGTVSTIYKNMGGKYKKKAAVYVRKTEDEYIVQGHYGQGWEDLTAADNRKEAI